MELVNSGEGEKKIGCLFSDGWVFSSLYILYTVAFVNG